MVLVAVLLCGSLTACKKQQEPQTAPQTETPSQVESSVPEESSQSVESSENSVIGNPQLTKKGCPPLEEELQQLYLDAYEMVRAFNLCLFEVNQNKSVDLNGMTYYAVADERFDSYEKLEDYLGTLFTDECIDTYLLSEFSCIQKKDGKAYQIDASGSEDVAYAGHVFTVESQTEKEISLKAVAYYVADAYQGKPFYKTPKNPQDYKTREFEFQLVATDDGWRFDQCPFMQ
jgi:hypothetical protein